MAIVRELLEKAGKGAELTLFSYSITDVWMRQLINLKVEMAVGKVIMVLDRDVIVRHREKLNQLQFVADEVYLTDTHAKVYLAKNNDYTIAAVTSANATNNLRHECFFITDRREFTGQIQDDIGGIVGLSYRII